MSRQTLYTEALADLICERLGNGESLRRICRSEGMVHRTTVERWMEENPEFAAKCARAREGDQADFYADLVVDTANACTPVNAAAARVKISAYQWTAAKLAPKKYGESVTTKNQTLDREGNPTDPPPVYAISFENGGPGQPVSHERSPETPDDGTPAAEA